VLSLKLCQRRFALQVQIQECDSKSEEISLELFAACSVLVLKRLIQERTKIAWSEQVLTNKKEVLKDERFLFHYLKLCPHFEEEESKNGVDNLNMAFVEEELLQKEGFI